LSKFSVVKAMALYSSLIVPFSPHHKPGVVLEIVSVTSVVQDVDRNPAPMSNRPISKLDAAVLMHPPFRIGR
jgi:hypothetical protein